ncbi:hypothetical protein ACFPIJ_17375 [Dactylosporangium cerinum]|uniref:Uncharacterized protein n=1 Tax=Dactylosporangium cerinum TaxID=1434730 RepID=A0ABV9VWL4_9ACTN
MNDIDPVFTTALQERADGDVRVEALLDGARRRGVRHRRNRRLATGAGAGLAVAAVLAATTLLPRGATAPAPGGSAPPTSRTATASSPAASSVVEKPRPPAASLAPLTAGGRIGEGHQIHLDTVDPTPFTLAWGSGNGVETIQASRGKTSKFGYSTYSVLVAQTAERLDQETAHLFAGEPQTEPLRINGGATGILRWSQEMATLRWQPLPDVWAMAWVRFHDSVPDPLPVITADDARGAMLEVSSAVRYDRVLRCTAQFRLTWAPPGTKTSACSLQWTGTTGSASFAFTVPGRGTFHVSDTDAADWQPNTTYAGKQVQSGRDGSWIVVDGRGYLIEPGDSGLTKDQQLHVLTGIQSGPPTDDPVR